MLIHKVNGEEEMKRKQIIKGKGSLSTSASRVKLHRGEIVYKGLKQYYDSTSETVCNWENPITEL